MTTTECGNGSYCVIVDVCLFFLVLILICIIRNQLSRFRNNRIINICYDTINILFYPIIIYVIAKFVFYHNTVIFYIFEYLINNKALPVSDIEDVYIMFINIMFKFSHIIKLFCVLLILHNIVVYMINKITSKSISNTQQEMALKTILKVVEFIILFFIVVLLLYIADVDMKTIFTTIITPLAAVMFVLKNKINNVFNGVIFVLSNTYQKNDFISIQQLNLSGFIEKITLSHVYIQTEEGDIIAIPISNFLENNITCKNTLGVCSLVVNVDIVATKGTLSTQEITSLFEKSKIQTKDVDIELENIVIKTVRRSSITVILYYPMHVTTFQEYNSYKNIVFRHVHDVVANEDAYECEAIYELK